METPREKRNREFLQYKAKNPSTTYAEWLNSAAVGFVRRGGTHATLGGKIAGFDNWWDAGRSTVERYRKLFPFQPGSRVVDYGCGSLRIGAHFIRALDPGCFFGLDVTMGLIEEGKKLVGQGLLDEKRPLFGTIDEPSLDRAGNFAPDLVYSTAVCYHVYPEEAPAYFDNLLRLTHRPGAVLLFDVSVSDQPVTEHALSMPLDYYKQALLPLEFVNLHMPFARPEQNQILAIAEFRRPSGKTA